MKIFRDIAPLFVLLVMGYMFLVCRQNYERAERLAAKELGCEHKSNDSCRGVK